MKHVPVIVLLLLTAVPAQAQHTLDAPLFGEVEVVRYARAHEMTSRHLPFQPDLQPFFHGVASGDPLTDRVILWTRVTPAGESHPTPIDVTWRMATDAEMTNIVQSGSTTADSDRDYTVKVDATGLLPGTTYYYDFEALGRRSLSGRTRTAPAGPVDQLRFAVVSCSNYPAGYFNAYARIAERADLDAVFHLGDYLYENAGGTHGDDRDVEPNQEIVELEDYRIRHSLYKLDPDLRAAHQQHPFIAVWDDHESANDSWEGGAQNHQDGSEGSWADRKADAVRAYFEWMPIRKMPGDDERIYRKLSYGDLADVFMLDTRLLARDRQLEPNGGILGGDIDTTAWIDPERRILGEEQFQWLTEELRASTGRWKVIGNQVMMVPLSPSPLFPAASRAVGEALEAQFNLPPGLIQIPEFTNLDAWDGYPRERERLLEYIRDEQVDNVVVLTGDIHSAWANDVPVVPYPSPPVFNVEADDDVYVDLEAQSTHPEASVAVEFVTTSVTSTTFAESAEAAFKQRGLPLSAEVLDSLLLQILAGAYPQVRAVDLRSRGYFVLDLTGARVQADYFTVPIDEPSISQDMAFHVYTGSGNNYLEQADEPAPEKPNPPALAPTATSIDDPSNEMERPSSLVVVGQYPNPVRDATTIHYALVRPQSVRIHVFDSLGRRIVTILDHYHLAGTYAVGFDASDLAAGTYHLRLEGDDASATWSMVVSK